MPITIGPFTNTPAPGDPIRSPWAQQITRYVVNRPFVALRATSQMTLSPNVNTTIVLNGASGLVDAYGMYTAGGLVVPSGYGGLYAVAVTWSVGSNNGGKGIGAWIGVGATRYGQITTVPSATEALQWGAAAVVNAAAGATIVFAAFHANAAAVAFGIQDLSAAYLGGNGGAPQ